VAWALFLLFCVAKALHLAAFTVLAGPLMRRGWAVPAIAALWVAIEFTHGSLGFAWLALGNAGIDMALPMRLAPFTGVYGLSFLFAALSVAVTVIIMRSPRRQLWWLTMFLVLFALPSMPQPEAGAETAVVVQPNLNEDQEW